MTDQTTPEAGATPAGTDTPPVISEPQGSTTEATGTVPAPYTLMTIELATQTVDLPKGEEFDSYRYIVKDADGKEVYVVSDPHALHTFPIPPAGKYTVRIENHSKSGGVLGSPFEFEVIVPESTNTTAPTTVDAVPVEFSSAVSGKVTFS